MNDLQAYWNKSTGRIQADKDPAAYALKKEPHFPRQSVICDLGGGTGVDSLLFASRGHTVHLIDISDAALSQAEDAAQTAGLQNALTTHQTNFEDARLPLDTASCDVVYSRLALHYFDKPTTSKLLAEVYRILKPGGQAWITVKSPDDAAEMEYLRSTATAQSEGIFEENGYLKTRFTIPQLEELLTTAGIPAEASKVSPYVEHFEGRKDTVRSGRTELLFNEITIKKPASDARAA